MACFQCLRCGRRHVVRPLDVEEGGQCPCGARYSVLVAHDDARAMAAHGDEGELTTWALDPDGSVYEVRFHA